MIILTSASYVDDEFRVEVGKLPHAMLPVGNKRLFEHQADILKKKMPSEPIYLSLPENFQIPKKDQLKIEEYQIKVIFVPEGITLADSVLFVANFIGDYNNEIKILHGDTLIYDLPQGKNLLTISKSSDDYNWEVEKKELNDDLVWSGYFSFSDTKDLVRCLTISKGSFVRGVRTYNKSNKINFIEVGEWLDFGHINNYFKSRSQISTERYFNSLKGYGGKIKKSSFDEKKISAELAWFDSIPTEIKFYTPQVLGKGHTDSGEFYYILEYLSCMPLNEIFVHALNPPLFWLKIFKHIEEFMNDCVKFGNTRINQNNKESINTKSQLLIVEKTKERVNEYIDSSKKDFNLPTSLNGEILPPINQILEECFLKVSTNDGILGVFHGDLCFSNILYDTRSEKIKVIDPRGVDNNGNLNFLGDLRYDLSKINHSIIGLYDHIIAGAYNLNESKDFIYEFEVYTDKRINDIQNLYLNNMRLFDLKPIDLMPETILLFLSMLPLHSDNPDKQNAFIANSLRIYKEYFT